MIAQAQIGVSTLIGVKRAEQILSRFRAKHPDVTLLYRECALDDLHDMFESGQADIIIVPRHTPIPPSADCLRLPLMLEQLVFVPRKADRHLWESLECVAISEIASELLVMLPDNCGLTRTTRRLFDSRGHAIRTYKDRVSCYQSMLDLIESSRCSGVLPASKVGDYSGVVVPIVDNGRPVAIEYIALGRLSILPPHLFTDLWDCLLESRVAVGLHATNEEARLTLAPRLAST